MATVNRIPATSMVAGDNSAVVTLNWTTEVMTLELVTVQVGTTVSQVRLSVLDSLGRVIASDIINGSDNQRVTIDKGAMAEAGQVFAFLECNAGSAIATLNEITGTGIQGLALTLADVPATMFTATAAGIAPFAAGWLQATAGGRALMATGFFTEAKATDAFAAQAITGALLKNATVTVTQLGPGAATLPKITFTGLKTIAFDGVNSAGGDQQVAAAGTVATDRVLSIFGSVKAAHAGTFLIPVIGTDFEAAITVNDKIVQLKAAGDLSLNTYVVVLAPATA